MSQLATSETVSGKKLLLFYRQFLMLFEAGIPIDQSLRILEQNEPDDQFALVLSTIERRIAGGSSLSQALSFHPRTFTPLSRALIRAGEETGSLVPCLNQVLALTERGLKIQRRVFSALAYPCVVLFVTLVISLVAVYFVIPEERAVWESQGLELPLFTRLVVGGLELLLHPVTLVGALLLSTLIVRLRVLSEKLPKLRDLLLLIPLLGPLLEKLAWARVLHCLGSLIATGQSFGVSMTLVSRSAGFSKLEARFRTFTEVIVKEGLDLYEAAEVSQAFTPVSRQFLTAAQFDMAGTLRKVAHMMDDVCEDEIESFTNFLEPLTLAITGLVIGSIVIALFLPTAGIVANLG